MIPNKKYSTNKTETPRQDSANAFANKIAPPMMENKKSAEIVSR